MRDPIWVGRLRDVDFGGDTPEDLRVIVADLLRRVVLVDPTGRTGQEWLSWASRLHRSRRMDLASCTSMPWLRATAQTLYEADHFIRACLVTADPGSLRSQQAQRECANKVGRAYARMMAPKPGEVRTPRRPRRWHYEW